MTVTEKKLLNFISDSLRNGSGLDFVADDEIVKEARQHGVAGFVAGKEERLSNIARYVKYLYCEEELIKLLERHNIPLVILKGSAAAVYYPEPSLRSFGDVDFLVPGELYEKSKRILCDNGFEEKGEQDENRHCGFVKDGFAYEMHHRFSYDDLDIEKYVISGMSNREIGAINEHKFPMLPPLANGLVLLAHLCAHLKSGLGLRQVIDWMMYCDKVLDDEFWNKEFKVAAEETGLKKLAVTVTALCRKYLGLKNTVTWCEGADENLVDSLIETIMSSGNFGRKKGIDNKVENTFTNFRREGLLKYLQRAGEHNWRAYHKHPKLRPFCWLYQIFRYLKQGIRKKSKLKDDINRSNSRYELLKELEIY